MLVMVYVFPFDSSEAFMLLGECKAKVSIN